jgi:hypothetical protein
MTTTSTSEDIILEKIAIIIRQTDYSEEIAREKLLEAEMDHIKVIKKFLGVTEKPPTKINSIQQQIYTEIRHKLDNSIKDFNLKQEKKIENDIKNL